MLHSVTLLINHVHSLTGPFILQTQLSCNKSYLLRKQENSSNICLSQADVNTGLKDYKSSTEKQCPENYQKVFAASI